jgi:hypothetical protein
MELTLAAVLNKIRDKHPAFSEFAVPNSLLVRQLSSYERDLITKATAANPFWHVRTKTLNLPVPVFAEGFAVPEAEHVLEGTVTLATGKFRKLTLTTYDDRFTPRRFPAAYLLRNVLYLMGLEASWTPAVTSIALKITPVTVDIDEASDAVFNVPSRAEGPLVASGALFCARRLSSRITAKELGELQAAYADAESTFYAGVGRMTT